MLLAGAAHAQPAGDPAAYVRARAADAAGAAQLASPGYAAALAAAPEDEVVAMRAYRQALAVGDYVLASRAGAVLVKAGVAPPDTAVLALAIALESHDLVGAGRAVDLLAKGPFDFLAPALRAWLAFDRGEDAVALLDSAPGDALARRYTSRHRVLLLIATKRTNEAMAALAASLAADDSDDTRIDAALLLARTGARDQAKRLLAGNRPEFVRLQKHFGKGKPDAAFGAARMFLELAVELAGEDMQPLTVLLTRSALLLDPRDDRARLFLAEALSQGGAHDLALGVLAEVQGGSPFARGAMAGRVAALRRAGRTAAALMLAEKLATGPDATSADGEAWGDLLADQGAYDGAAGAYAAAIERPGGETNSMLHYLQGRALDRAGRWREALPLLRRAVALGPEQVQVLKYLGNAEVLRGEDIAEAQALLERARALKPDDAEIADSLAWALFQRGDVRQALPLLEQAVKGDPAAARANEHLGDAYWRLGRHYEARYAWRAATLTAENDAASRLEAKLAHGLKPRTD